MSKKHEFSIRNGDEKMRVMSIGCQNQTQNQDFKKQSPNFSSKNVCAEFLDDFTGASFTCEMPGIATLRNELILLFDKSDSRPFKENIKSLIRKISNSDLITFLKGEERSELQSLGTTDFEGVEKLVGKFTNDAEDVDEGTITKMKTPLYEIQQKAYNKIHELLPKEVQKEIEKLGDDKNAVEEAISDAIENIDDETTNEAITEILGETNKEIVTFINKAILGEA